MIFFEKIRNLNSLYAANLRAMRDNAFLYGIKDSAPPLADHIVFPPMPEALVLEMVNNYKQAFPKDLLELYRFMNGANLFWTVNFIGAKRRRIPSCQFAIFGIPLTYNRMQIEPFNISIEDLNRPEGTPNNWLKFGSYCAPNKSANRFDLFIDTDLDCVHAVEHNLAICHVSETWPSVDNCLCRIFDLLSDTKG